MNRYIPFLLWLSAGIALSAWFYIDEVYPLDVAIGFISRAQATGYAESSIRYLQEAIPLIPDKGNPVWIFPTSRTDFSLIHEDLELIQDRLEIVAKLSRDSPAYSQALNDIRGRLEVIINNLGEAMPYVFFSPVNSAILLIWFFLLPIGYIIRGRVQKRGKERFLP